MLRLLLYALIFMASLALSSCILVCGFYAAGGSLNGTN